MSEWVSCTFSLFKKVLSNSKSIWNQYRDARFRSWCSYRLFRRIHEIHSTFPKWLLDRVKVKGLRFCFGAFNIGGSPLTKGFQDVCQKTCVSCWSGILESRIRTIVAFPNTHFPKWDYRYPHQSSPMFIPSTVFWQTSLHFWYEKGFGCRRSVEVVVVTMLEFIQDFCYLKNATLEARGM